MNKIILLALSWFSLLVVCCCISNDMRQKRFRFRIDSVKWSNATKSQVWIGIGALALCCPHSTWLPCSTFSQPFYLQLPLSAYQQPMPSFRLNGGCYGNFGRHKSPAARRSEESRKSTLFVSTRAHGERTAVVPPWLREGEEEVGGWQTPARSRALELLARLHAQKTLCWLFFLKEDIIVQFCFFSSNSDAVHRI